MREIVPRHNQRITAIADAGEDTGTEYVYKLEGEEPRLRDYWKMLVKRRRLAVLVFLAVFGLGAFLTFASRGRPLYTASATIKIEPQNPSAMAIEEMLTAQVVRDASFNYYPTQFALLKSGALAARVIAKLGLESNPAFTEGNPLPLIDRMLSRLFGPLESFFTYVSRLLEDTPTHTEGPPRVKEFALGVHPGLIDLYLRYLTVEPVPNTRLVKVLFKTPDPQLSQALANTHAATFIRMGMETRFELTKEAQDFLEHKRSELKAKFERSEQALHRFRQAHGVISMAGNENIVVERMVDLNKRLTEARARRIELESLYRMVKNKNAQYLSQVIGNSMIQQHKVRLDTLEAEQARLATIFMPDHPRLLEISPQIRGAQRRLSLEIANIVRGIESDYADARAKEQALEAEAKRQQQAALNLKELGVEYNVLQGEVDANRAVYESVLKRLTETNVSKDVSISNIQTIEPAEMPLKPAPRQTPRNLQLAAAVALLCGVGLAIFLEYLNSTVNTPEDVWRALSVPTLGVVPHLRSLRHSIYGYGRLPKRSPLRRLAHPSVAAGDAISQNLTVSYHPLSLISESYRSIRTVLLLAQAKKPPQVTLLTSAHPGEGKTTITVNLAIALAQSRRTVVVVDADLRKGNCHTLLHLPNHRGLTDILTDGLTLEEGVQRTTVTGLSLLSRGSVPPNPTDLLDSSKMKEVLQGLRERFDFVLIDSPPVIAVSDAAVLSALCDGVLLVLRGQRTTVEAARRAVEHLEAVGAPILGAVLNAIDIRNPDYADYRRYYTSYYAAAHGKAEKPD